MTYVLLLIFFMASRLYKNTEPNIARHRKLHIFSALYSVDRPINPRPIFFLIDCFHTKEALNFWDLKIGSDWEMYRLLVELNGDKM